MGKKIFSLEEVKDIIRTYELFRSRREAFVKDPEKNGYFLFREIGVVRKIPKRLRDFLEDFKMSNEELDILKRECKKYEWDYTH